MDAGMQADVGGGNISEYKLVNGLKLVVKEDHRSPVVVSQVWYKVGSSYEYNGITGISHYLEHMMFKGTDTLSPNDFSKIISANGGRGNAFTGRDYTAYFQTLGKDRLEVSFRLEAERMHRLQIDEMEMLRERNVVSEERRMRIDDNPKSLLYESFNSTAFVNSSYHHPIIGWMSDIQNYNIDDLNIWYQKWYVPNNATVVVVGDVEALAVYNLAKEHFAPLQARKIAALKPQIEISQRGIRSIQVKIPAALPYLMMGWKVPVIKTSQVDWEPYALEVLASILDGGGSARLSRELIREYKVAAGVNVMYSLYSRLKDVFTIVGTPAQDKSIKDLRLSITTQLEQLKQKLISPSELKRVKAQVVANAIYEGDSVFHQAIQIGMLETVGLDWQYSNDYVKNISGVTAEQVMYVVRRYFLDNSLTVAELMPLSVDRKSIHPSVG